MKTTTKTTLTIDERHTSVADIMMQLDLLGLPTDSQIEVYNLLAKAFERSRSNLTFNFDDINLILNVYDITLKLDVDKVGVQKEVQTEKVRKHILVTGGLGYIGSHTVVELLNADYKVTIVDDLSNSTISVLDAIIKITGKKPELTTEHDLSDEEDVEDLLDGQSFDAVIHFAASKSVSESVSDPLLYYMNNITPLTTLLRGMSINEVDNIIFSSSCTVYGQADEMPITESTPLKDAESPYGSTKQMAERILSDVCKASDLHSIALRYFNPVGCHESHLIGDRPQGVPQNLVPYLTQTALGQREVLSIFGDNYDTPDGTASRDYIHVVDLAKAHLAALDRMLNEECTDTIEYYNIGTGKPTTVLELVEAFEEANTIDVPWVITDRRDGDIEIAYADASLAKKVLGWEAKETLQSAMKSAYEFELAYMNNHLID